MTIQQLSGIKFDLRSADEHLVEQTSLKKNSSAALASGMRA